MKKLKFETVDELIEKIYEVAYDGEYVTVVANDDIAIPLIKGLLSDNDDIRIGIIEINTYDYECVYHVSVHYEEDETFVLNVEKGVNQETGRPYGTDGYVLFADDVCESVINGMIENENVDFRFDIFSFGKMKESCLIYRDGYGNINGFTKTWTDDIGTSTYSFHSDNVDMIKDIATGFGIDL